jgi:hypothetical protein
VITGTGFTPSAQVFLAGLPLANVVVHDETTITATTPARVE